MVQCKVYYFSKGDLKMVQCKAFLEGSVAFCLWLLGPFNDIILKSMVISLLKNHVSMYNVHVVCTMYFFWKKMRARYTQWFSKADTSPPRNTLSTLFFLYSLADPQVWFLWFWSHFFLLNVFFDNVKKCVLGGCVITSKALLHSKKLQKSWF